MYVFEWLLDRNPFSAKTRQYFTPLTHSWLGVQVPGNEERTPLELPAVGTQARILTKDNHKPLRKELFNVFFSSKRKRGRKIYTTVITVGKGSKKSQAKGPFSTFTENECMTSTEPGGMGRTKVNKT